MTKVIEKGIFLLVVGMCQEELNHRDYEVDWDDLKIILNIKLDPNETPKIYKTLEQEKFKVLNRLNERFTTVLNSGIEGCPLIILDFGDSEPHTIKGSITIQGKERDRELTPMITASLNLEKSAIEVSKNYLLSSGIHKVVCEVPIDLSGHKGEPWVAYFKDEVELVKKVRFLMQ